MVIQQIITRMHRLFCILICALLFCCVFPVAVTEENGVLTIQTDTATSTDNPHNSIDSGAAIIQPDPLSDVFSVTVPTVIPITLTGDGEVLVDSTVKIINNSSRAVSISKVSISGENGWTLIDFNDGDSYEVANVPVDTNRIGIKLEAGGAQISTSQNGNSQIFSDLGDTWTITGSEMSLHYDAIATPVSFEYSQATVMSIVFVIDWASATDETYAEPVRNDVSLSETEDNKTLANTPSEMPVPEDSITDIEEVESGLSQPEASIAESISDETLPTAPQ